MNREIKFRGKRVCNEEWIHGDLTHDINGKPFIHFAGYSDRGMGVEFTHEVIPETIGQFTNLKDKNGREIYEGDYIYCRDALCEGYSFEGVVKFQSGGFMVKSDIDSHYRWADYETEVIGNIFSNPVKEGI